jgi:hypothetical protein
MTQKRTRRPTPAATAPVLDTSLESSPGAPSTEAAALEVAKMRIEIEKLNEEVATAREGRTWWRRSIRDVKLSEWLTAAAAIIALVAAFWTGLFNSIRERLSAQADRLAMEQIDLEHKKDGLRVEIAAKEQELAVVKGRLAPFEEEAGAIKELRRYNTKLLHVTFSITPDSEAYRITISGMDEKLDWSLVTKSRANPYLPDALREVNRVRSLKGLRVRGLRMSHETIALASQHTELEVLDIREGSLDHKTLADLKPLPKLKNLNVELSNIASFEGSGLFPSVERAHLGWNPLDDSAIPSLMAAFPNVVSLDLRGTKVTNEGMKKLVHLERLLSIDLENTVVTGAGLLELAQNPKLLSVTIDETSITEQDRRLLKSRRPNDLSVIHRDARDRARDAFDSLDRW